MWMFTKYGFYSVVSALKAPEYQEIDPAKVCVRARNRNHLVALLERFPGLIPASSEIVETTNRDYRYRILADSREWIATAMELSRDISYDNFKDEAEKLGDDLYTEALHEVWEIMFQMQKDVAHG